MAGSATFTTVESTVTTVVPRIAATSVSRSCEAAGGGVASDSSLDEGVAVFASLTSGRGARAVDRVGRPRLGADVAGARPDQPALPLLLHDVGGPAAHAGAGEQRREQVRWDVREVQHDGRPEIDVGGKDAVGLARSQFRERRLLELLRHLEARRADLARGAAEHAGARVLRPVDAVAEAHQAIAAVERVLDPELGV